MTSLFIVSSPSISGSDFPTVKYRIFTLLHKVFSSPKSTETIFYKDFTSPTLRTTLVLPLPFNFILSHYLMVVSTASTITVVIWTLHYGPFSGQLNISSSSFIIYGRSFFHRLTGCSYLLSTMFKDKIMGNYLPPGPTYVVFSYI